MSQKLLKIDPSHTRKLLRGESIAVRFKDPVPNTIVIILDHKSLLRGSDSFAKMLDVVFNGREA